MIQRAKLQKLYIPLIVPFVFGLASDTKIKVIGPERLADRLALTLVGHLASEADKEALADQKISIDDYMERLLTEPNFEVTLAKYWNKVFKISEISDFMSNSSALNGAYPFLATNTYDIWVRRFTEGGRALAPTAKAFGCQNFDYQGFEPYDFSPLPEPANEAERIVRDAYLKNNLCASALNLIPAVVTPTGTVAAHYEYTRTNDAGKSAVGVNPVSITPWWAQTDDVKKAVFPGLVSDNYCGANLEKCFPYRQDEPGNDESFKPFWNSVKFGMTLEPGLLAARMIKSKRPWSQVLTTSETVFNGPQAYFIERWGSELFANAPVGTFDKFKTPANKAPSGVFAWRDSAQKAFSFPFSSPRDHGFHTVDRGGKGHAGVLTTVSWQRTYNGERAKANAVMTSFLCKQFVALPSSKQTPSDEPDLAKRPYCQDCHTTMEPMSNFFNRWSPRGLVNFAYTPAKNADGALFGQPASDVDGLANLVVKDPDFATCAVKRSFEILIGRLPTLEEELSVVPDLLKVYNTGDGLLWPVLKAVAKLPMMLNGG